MINIGIVESRTFISVLINTRPASRESPLKLCHLLLKALQKERRRQVFFSHNIKLIYEKVNIYI